MGNRHYMDYFGYLDQEYWESAMKAADVRKMNVIGIDWRPAELCARRLIRDNGIYRTVPLLAEGEYVHKRNCRSPEAFFCGKLEDFFNNIQAIPGAEDDDGGLCREKPSLLLVSVPESRLERWQALKFAVRLEQMAGTLSGSGPVNVILFPRIRTVWEYCRNVCPEGFGTGVIQVLETETQFLLHPGQEVSVSFGDCLAKDGRSRQYYNKPVRYRENNYLYEADRFLWQDAAYASWYQGFGRICRKVFAALGWKKEQCFLALTGSEFALPCAEKALADMEAAADGGLYRINEIPTSLLHWFCRVRGLEWGEDSLVSEHWRNHRDGRKDAGRNAGHSGKPAENIWDI